jgi:hypothetical protein
VLNHVLVLSHTHSDAIYIVINVLVLVMLHLTCAMLNFPQISHIPLYIIEKITSKLGSLSFCDIQSNKFAHVNSLFHSLKCRG